ncbi:all-trans retinoic acid-induced differentiation factor-like [Pomacea canaliculata]|uniref:all-trans retinoic acid-induced differentiation factor-like n=1 Tax=Pomacea canaliculata TaxID=400727 RepID=UPI000D72F7DD|nr:all-trans retinoic acid-induced differentiation factor-like [Pomacea canaliculata]
MWLKVIMCFKLLVLLVIADTTLESFASVCQRQCESDMKKQVKADCSSQGLNISGRCCYNETSISSAVVIDLHNCSLDKIDDLFKNLTHLKNISLEDNPLFGIQALDFYKLTELEYLWLPVKSASAECPGGVSAWNKSEMTSSVLFCQKLIDPCVENNETCPNPQSYCKPAGPGLVDCLCSPGYHGYKCLRQGSFPTAAFAGGLAGSTLALSAVLCFFRTKGIKKHSS